MRRTHRAAALAAFGVLALAACHRTSPRAAAVAPAAAPDPAVFWNSATVYFLLTDRFLDGDTANDHALGRASDGAVLRSYQGGDLKGVLRRLEEGYFDRLGVTALWLTPFVEQVHGSVDEGTGTTYAYHGYWTRDWTAVDPALGTKADLKALVDAAHRHHIRILMDAVINHTGPETPLDPRWPDDWVRRGPNCTYRSYATAADCDLVATLPDVRTESDQPVELPAALVAKWRAEGRLDAERASLDSFFLRTGYPRAPRYYIIKWLTDWVREAGIDGYRVDTAKHFGEAVSAELKTEAQHAFTAWKRAHPAQVLDSLPFYMVGEVYGWAPGQGRQYDYGDRSVDFFAHGYDGLINFAFKSGIRGPLDSVYATDAAALHGALRGVSILNYVSSHDDGQPYDPDRRDPYGAGTRLLLAPGGAQIYYGDELARPLRIPGTQGDATLRSNMRWGDLIRPGPTADILEHWRKLGRFRRAHPAVGAGEHHLLAAEPYVFSRTLESNGRTDRVVVAEGLRRGFKSIPVAGVFADGTRLTDAYSGETARVRHGALALTTPFDLALLSEGNGEEDSSGSVVVNVVNNYEIPMDIYASAGGTSYRMGVVNPGIPSRFLLRRDLLMGDRVIAFVAKPSGIGPQVRAGEVALRYGDAIIDVEITTNLAGSRATIRP